MSTSPTPSSTTITPEKHQTHYKATSPRIAHKVFTSISGSGLWVHKDRPISGAKDVTEVTCHAAASATSPDFMVSKTSTRRLPNGEEESFAARFVFRFMQTEGGEKEDGQVKVWSARGTNPGVLDGDMFLYKLEFEDGEEGAENGCEKDEGTSGSEEKEKEMGSDENEKKEYVGTIILSPIITTQASDDMKIKFEFRGEELVGVHVGRGFKGEVLYTTTFVKDVRSKKKMEKKADRVTGMEWREYRSERVLKGNACHFYNRMEAP